MSRLLLLRHGETEWNVTGRITGQADPPLNAAGRAQAERVAAQMAESNVEAIYSSDLQRARLTAEIIAGQLGLAVVEDKRLREIHQGNWEGLQATEILARFPREWAERERNPLHARASGGESAAEVAARMSAAADEIARKHPVGPVLIVSHGLALATLICRARGLPLRQVRELIPDNAHLQAVDWFASSDLLNHLVALYGEEAGRAAFERVNALLDRYRPVLSPPPPRPPAPLPIAVSGRDTLSERDSILITYGDQIREPDAPPLQTLADFCEQHLAGLVSGIHILPFYPYSSDDGFSVIDYRAVDPALGTWDDVARLGRRFRLMFDAVINHVSAKSEWFRAFLQGDPKFRRYFIAVEDDPDLSQVVRPRALPLLTEFQTASGAKKVWTTFSGDQIDLNYHNPDVLLEIIDVLLFYISRGAEFIRLDAIAYLWKEIGTSCIHLPQTHRIVQLFRAVLDEIAPHVSLITETNVPHKDNISYFGDGPAAREAHLVYNFALPPLMLHTIHTGNARALSDWARGLTLPSDRVAFFNFLASHDGIGLNPVRGILDEADVDRLVERAIAHGGLVSCKHNPDGSQTSYELNLNYFDAVSDPANPEPPEAQVGRFIAAQAIMLALAGVPGIYFHSLFGSRGWPEGARQTGRNRTINRQKCDRAELERELADPTSLRHKVFSRCSQLLRARAASPAFHPHGAQRVIDCGEAVFAVLRMSPDGDERVLCLHNVAGGPCSAEIDLQKVLGSAQARWRDLTMAETISQQERPTIALLPYQVLWIANL